MVARRWAIGGAGFSAVASAPIQRPRAERTEAYIKALTLWLATGTEAAAALIIGLATVEATIGALLLFLPGTGRHADPQAAKEEVRLRLGRWLAVALEFELGADILRTAVAPTWSEIGQLAAIAAIRTLLNYFLQKEIDKAEAKSDPAGGPRATSDQGTAP